MGNLTSAFLALFAVLFSSSVLAEGDNITAENRLTAEQIIEQSNLASVYAGNDGRAEARMLIVDKQGRKQFRQFTLLKRNLEKGGDQQYLVVFSRPADVNRTSFLVDKHPGKDDDRWLYLPGLDLVKRISAGDKRTSFVGSNFFYEDISGRHIEDDTFELLEDNVHHWIIKATPKSSQGVEFAWYQVEISKHSFLPIKAEYFNGQGKMYRRMTASKVVNVQGIPTISEMKAEDLDAKSYSLLQMRNIQYDLGMGAEVFTERSLRMPPRQWLK